MVFKERLRRAIGRPDRASSTSSSQSQQSTPTITPVTTTAAAVGGGESPLTKTSSRLTKTLTFRSLATRAKKDKGAEADGDDDDPSAAKHAIGTKSKKQHDLLHAFEWNFGRKSIDGANSTHSGVSPTASRNVSVDDGQLPRALSAAGKRKSSALAGGAHSREPSAAEVVEVTRVAEES